MEILLKSNVKRLLSALLVVSFLTAGFCSPAHAIGRYGVDEDGEQTINQKWLGDYDQMVDDRIIRFLIPYSKTFFFLDGVKERGLSYEAARSFEKMVNDRHKKGHLKVHVVVIPTARNELLEKLADGYGDIAIGNLTITDKRREKVAFSDPFLKNVEEVVLTRKDTPDIANVMALAGKEIYVRKSSSYYESIQKLNDTLVAIGKPPVKITLAEEQLEDEDLLEMLDAGVVSMLVVDKHKAEFWVKIFDNIKIHPKAAVYSGGQIAWAFRKNSPQLQEVVNLFAKQNKKGTLHGNMAFNKYLKNTKHIENPDSKEDHKRFKAMVVYFKKYGKQYDFNYLMLTALAYQESKLNQGAKSHVGAVGVMQLLPSTAKDKNVNIPNIHEPEANIHAGTKYLRFMVDRYFGDPEISRINKGLLAFASYNAGPAKVARLRKEAKEMGLDPNIWFENVEVVAAKRIGRETVQYVSNIFKYFVVYSLLAEKGKL